MANGLVKLLVGIAFVGLSAWGGYSSGKYLCYKNYQSAQKEMHGRVVSREEYNHEIGMREIVWGLFFGAVAGSIVGGIGLGITCEQDSNSDSKNERNPELDDPGAFGPGGLRY